jgi:hypothetical protein
MPVKTLGFRICGFREARELRDVERHVPEVRASETLDGGGILLNGEPRGDALELLILEADGTLDAGEAERLRRLVTSRPALQRTRRQVHEAWRGLKDLCVVVASGSSRREDGLDLLP